MSAPYIPGPQTLYDPSATASATQLGPIPTLDQYGYDVAAWQKAVQDYAKLANGGPAFPTMPTDQQMTDAFGSGWSAAGSGMHVPSLGEYQARLLNTEYVHQYQPGVKGPSFGLQMQAREHARPGEMQAAYDAIDPETGKPVLLPQISGYLESTYGTTPTQPGQTAPGGAPGSAPAVNPPGGTFYDPASHTLIPMGANPDPAQGWLEVPNNFSPNDPNAPRITQAMGYINLFVKQGSLYGADNTANWQTLHSILDPLGIDPAVFVAGVLNYNNIQINDDGTLASTTQPFAGYTPPGPNPNMPPGVNSTPAPYQPASGATAPASNPSGPVQQPGVNDPVGQHSQSLVNQHPQTQGIDLTRFDPGSMQPATSYAGQLAKQYGNTSTIDPRYPDWMLLNRPQQAQHTLPPGGALTF